ncbi:MFS transporter [Gammaproteobacteria bacterium]|nr:MFS transporter [Gammaproteobacteria bacterium]
MKSIKPVLIVSTAATFYFYMFLVRVMMASIMDEVSLTFSLSDSDLGFLSASFVIFYSLSQIPTGRLIDQLGARKVLLMSTVGVILSSILFQAANSYEVALLSRALLGLSCGCAFIAPLTLTHQWLNERHFSTSAGLIQMLGCFGAIFSGRPIISLINQIGWRDGVLLSAIIAIILFLIYFIVIEDRISTQESSTPLPLMSALKQIICNPNYQLIGIIAFASWALIGGFTELWGAKFLMQLQNVDQSFATSQLILTWISIGIASPIFGFITEYISMYRAILISYLTGLISLLLLISGYITSEYAVSFLLLLMGISSGGQPVAFGMINSISSEKLMATAVGLCNICVIAGAFVMQPLIGYILDLGLQLEIIERYRYCIAFTPIACALIFGIIAAKYVNINVKVGETA